LETLPFIGLVERFEASVAALRAYLRPRFPNFEVRPVHENASDAPNPRFSEKLARIRDSLGQSLFDELLEANAQDLIVFYATLARLEAMPAGTAEE
jgi:hypothetical protein